MKSIQDAQNRKNVEKKSDEKEKASKKVIHIWSNVKMEKNELYTKLCTLSTSKNKKIKVYIVKISNVCFVHK